MSDFLLVFHIFRFMTTHKKLIEYSAKPIKFNGPLASQPIIIGDSKGVYLKKYGSGIFESVCHIEFECKGGARFADYLYWLERNLYNRVKRFGHVTLYIFCGTCDLTKLVHVKENNSNRVRRYIELRHNSDNAAVRYLTDQIEKISRLVSRFPTVSIVFLEIPPYSIQAWNRTQGHPNPSQFQSADKILNERICIVNEFIKEKNDLANVESPKFNLDLKRARKISKSKRQRQDNSENHRRYSLSFGEYKDGIHSGPLLSRVWMKRIVLRIIKDCA